MRQQTQGGALLLGATLCWGVSIPLSKGLLGGVPPLWLIVWQLMGSVLLLVAVAAERRLRWWRQAQPVRLGLIGMLEPGMAYGLGFIGLQWTTAVHAAVLFSAEPFAILIFAALLGGFGPRRQADVGKLLAGIGSMAGVALIALTDTSAATVGSLQGDALVLAGVCCAALYVALTARQVQAGSALGLLIVQQFGSLLLAVCALVLWGAPRHSFSAQPVGDILAAMAVGMLQFALAFWLYLEGLKRAGASFWSVFVLNLTPLIGVASSALLLGEPLGPAVLLGGGLIVSAAVYLHAREQRG